MPFGVTHPDYTLRSNPRRSPGFRKKAVQRFRSVAHVAPGTENDVWEFTMRLTRLILTILAALALSAAPQGATKAPTKADPKAQSGSAKKAPALLDINTATAEQLAELPGIGKAYSEKIIKNRPYRAKNELVDKNIIPDSVYQKVRDRIIAKQ
jgi:DNA uptake protein ComE-like DNA-binding protein